MEGPYMQPGYVEITAGLLPPAYFVINRIANHDDVLVNQIFNDVVYIRPVNDPTQEGALVVDPMINDWAVQGSDTHYRIVFLPRSDDEQASVELLPGYDILRKMSVNGQILSIYSGASPDDYQDLVLLDGKTITDWSFLQTPAVKTDKPIVIVFNFKREHGPVNGPTLYQVYQVAPTNGLITVGNIFDAILQFGQELNENIPDTELETSEVENVRHTVGNQFLVTYFEP